MNYLLVFYTGTEIKNAIIKKGEAINVGSGENDNIKIQNCGLEANHLNLRFIDGGINIFSRTPFSIAGETSVNRIVSAGDSVKISKHLMLIIFESCCYFENPISLNGLKEINIGRSVKNDICLKGSMVSSSHAVIRKDKSKNKWIIKDKKSRNGIFLNGNLVNDFAELNNGANIFMGGFVFEFLNETLIFKNTPDDLILSNDLIRRVFPVLPDLKKKELSFYRSPRIRKSASTTEVEVLAPPNAGTKPSISWLPVLLPPCIMIFVMLSVAMFTKNITTLFYTLPMSTASITVSVLNYRSQMKKWAHNQELAGKKYNEHLNEKEAEITDAEILYMSTLSSINPGIIECISIAKNIDRRLWERSLRDSDFLNVRLGTGQTVSNVSIKIPKEQLVLEENPFLKEAAKLKERHEILSGIPVCHSFLDAPITGLVGSHENVIKMAWSILINIATHHSYDDVKIVCIYPDYEKEQWEWIRWLPHVWNAEKTRRYMSCTLENKYDAEQKKKTQDKTARAMLRELAETLKVRRRESSDNNSRDNIPETPFYFLVFADKTLVESSGEQFLPESSALGFAVLYAYGDISTLPGECNAVIECGEPDKKIPAFVQMTEETSGKKIFMPDSKNIRLNLADKFARSLAPVRVHSSGRTGTIPTKALFLHGLGVTRVEELEILRRWKSSQSYSSLAVPIGFKANSDIFEFNIHENKMGPHGLVAGTSGSGKSEMLTTWLLSLAVHFSPEDVNFLLIEFKGNDLSNILKNLPQVAGVVSNLQDTSSIERSLRSLRGEIDRRQRIFESLSELDTKAIFKYQEYQKKHRDKNLEPMPYLIVIVDEFAEFRSQYPEQLDEFISIARVGRSLGLYMVLATQSPGGIVSGQVSANTKFRICLKTADSGESKDMIGTADAFHISLPGRAYVKVGNFEVYEQIQTFFAKAPYHPGEDNQKQISEINLVEINGARVSAEMYENTVKTSKKDVLSEGKAVVSHIIKVAEENNIHKANPIWTEALPEVIALSWLHEKYAELAFENDVWTEKNTGLSFIVGFLDNPEQQCQYPFVLDFVKDGHQILYGAPSSGKTTFLQTAILSAAFSYTPQQLQFLVLDFGNWGMKIFEGLPHMLMVADANDKEKLQRAEEYYMNELDTRKNLFASQGVGTLEAYQQVSGKILPAMLIAVDNLAALKDQYPDMLDSIIKVAREGGGLGIYLLLTSTGSSMFRIDQFIKSKHALQLTDPTEYRAIVGGHAKQEPGHFAGRGFTKGPLEFQTALCVEGETEGERVMKLREICTAMRNAWKGKRASLNEAETHEIIADELEIIENGFQIGIAKISKKPVDFVFSEMTTCIISAKTENSRRNIISLIINAAEHDETDIYLYEREAKLSSLYPECRAVYDNEGANEIISELADEFDLRSNEEEAEHRRIIFLIDDFLGFYRGISQESADILETLTRSGADFNIYIYIACSVENLASLNIFKSSIKSFDNCLKKGNAIAAGGNIRDYTAFNEIHHETDINFSEGEGALIHGDKLQIIKFAKAGGE